MAWPLQRQGRRGEAMPRPYPATPRVAHNPEAMPRPQSFVKAPPGPGGACSGEAMPPSLAYVTLREREVAATAAAAGLSGLRSL